jgi:acid phosphatase family membrane protein YuiD
VGLLGILSNQPLLLALAAWVLAQLVKLPLEYLRTRTWNWAILFQAGGMPSSHSALVSSAAYGIGLTDGFDTPAFAVATVVATIVVYDATGIRRQAGRHAEIINTMIQNLVEGHPLRQEVLREVLGHSPGEAVAGLAMGLGLTHLIWLISLGK